MKKIIYIAGIGHSGSTLLDIILGEGSNAITGGQIGSITYLKRSDKCSCGKSISSCQLWSDIFDKYYQNDWQDVLSRINGEKNILKFLFSKAYCKEYAEINDKIFNKIFKKTNKELIIDSTKNISRGIALARSSRYEIYFLHLIRDSRGYINSFNKRRIESGNDTKLIRPYFEWTIKNITASILGRLFAGENYFQVKYESLVTKPSETINLINEKTGIKKEDILRKIENDEKFGIRHIFAGNRISKSPVKLKITENKSYKLKHYKDAIYWYSLGLITTLWGYNK